MKIGTLCLGMLGIHVLTEIILRPPPEGPSPRNTLFEPLLFEGFSPFHLATLSVIFADAHGNFWICQEVGHISGVDIQVFKII